MSKAAAGRLLDGREYNAVPRALLPRLPLLTASAARSRGFASPH
jgi:hypothetical protein